MLSEWETQQIQNDMPVTKMNLPTNYQDVPLPRPSGLAPRSRPAWYAFVSLLEGAVAFNGPWRRIVAVLGWIGACMAFVGFHDGTVT